jgi:hypothetical protein
VTDAAYTPPVVPALPPENVQRGTVLTLAIIPAGIIVWAIIWSFGFIASIVAFGIALGAVFLYRLGSGGRIGRQGAVSVTLITIVTLLLAFFAGIVVDGLQGFSTATGESWVVLITDPIFWNQLFAILGEDGVLASYAPNFGLALLFGALGCFSVLRGAFREAAATPPAAFEYPIAPQANGAPQGNNIGVDYSALPPVPPVTPPATDPVDPNAPRV